MSRDMALVSQGLFSRETFRGRLLYDVGSTPETGLMSIVFDCLRCVVYCRFESSEPGSRVYGDGDLVVASDSNGGTIFEMLSVLAKR